MRALLTTGLVAMTLASPSLAQGQNPLAGTWRQEDGKVTIRMANCTASRDLCATVVGEKPDLSEPRRLGNVIVSDIKAAGTGRWTGRFTDQGATFNAKIRQTAPGVVSFKICAFAFLCDTKRFDRIKP